MYSISKSCLLLLVASLAFAKSPFKKSAKKSASPIVNGQIVTSPAVFPYQVLITGPDGGGTIVSKRWVLTAAHVAILNSNMQLYAGVIDRNNLAAGQNRTLKQYRNHPNYSNGAGQGGTAGSPANDVSLIEVTTPFVYGTNVTDVKLASDNNQSLWNVGQTPTVTGFGRTAAGSSLSNELRQVNVQVTSINNGNI